MKKFNEYVNEEKTTTKTPKIKQLTAFKKSFANMIFQLDIMKNHISSMKKFKKSIENGSPTENKHTLNDFKNTCGDAKYFRELADVFNEFADAFENISDSKINEELNEAVLLKPTSGNISVKELITALSKAKRPNAPIEMFSNIRMDYGHTDFSFSIKQIEESGSVFIELKAY